MLIALLVLTETVEYFDIRGLVWRIGGRHWK